MAKPTGYTRFQIVLHWGIAVVIAAQFLLADGMETSWDMIEKGQVPAFSFGATAHVTGGILVLLFSIWRMAIKIRRGSPALPESEPRIQKIAAHATHGILYLLLILVPASGLGAWFGGVMSSADAHEVLTTILLIVVGLHFAAAIYHHFILKSNILRRMLRAE